MSGAVEIPGDQRLLHLARRPNQTAQGQGGLENIGFRQPVHGPGEETQPFFHDATDNAYQHGPSDDYHGAIETGLPAPLKRCEMLGRANACPHPGHRMVAIG